MAFKEEFSRIFNFKHLSVGDSIINIEATREERKKLAKRFDLLSISRFISSINISVNSQKNSFRLLCKINAEFEQICIITLEPLKSSIEKEFTRNYTTLVKKEAFFDELDLSEVSEDAPEPLIKKELDFGEIVSEQFGLEIDPFPRSQGSNYHLIANTYADNSKGILEEAKAPGPFAILEKLKGTLEK